jgi:hypothetical protein
MVNLSLSLLQSRFLEANNKMLKDRRRALPGGGGNLENSGGNNPLFLYAEVWF